MKLKAKVQSATPAVINNTTPKSVKLPPVPSVAGVQKREVIEEKTLVRFPIKPWMLWPIVEKISLIIGIPPFP